MINNEAQEMMDTLNTQCFMNAMDLLAAVAQHRVTAKLSKEDVLRIMHWAYLDIKKNGVNSFYHKEKKRELQDSFYITELINIYLIARDQFNII